MTRICTAKHTAQIKIKRFRPRLARLRLNRIDQGHALAGNEVTDRHGAGAELREIDPQPLGELLVAQLLHRPVVGLGSLPWQAPRWPWPGQRIARTQLDALALVRHRRAAGTERGA